MPASRPFRTAVIGYGFAGKSFHSYLVSLTPGLQLHGIASRSPETREAILARGDCKAYASFEEAIADPDVDLVVIASPNSQHAPQAIAALNAGKNVVVDKPMCLSLDEADAMIAAARNNNKLLSIFHNRRWDGDFLTAQQVMQSGQLGEVKWIELSWGRVGAYRSWRGQKEHGGGRFWDLGAHLLDQLMLFYEGYPIESVYLRKQYDFPEFDVEQMRQMLEGEILSYEIERRLNLRRGSEAWVLLSVSLVRDNGGKPLYFLAQLQDITKRSGCDFRRNLVLGCACDFLLSGKEVRAPTT